MDHEPRPLTPHRRRHWGAEPDPEPETPPSDDTIPPDPADRRRVLWRDSATILIGVILALLLAQAFVPRDPDPTAVDRSTDPTSVAIGETLAPRSVAPGETLEPIVDPSLDIDATQTPGPVITLEPLRTPRPDTEPGPSPSGVVSPSPTPGVTPRPTRTPRPPTAPPTAAPTPKPTPRPTPPPTEPPTPTVSISCETRFASMTITCSSSTNIQAGSHVWDPGGPGDGDDTTASLEWTYTLPGTYTVRLTVTGTDGTTASDEDTVTVPGL